MDAACGSSFFTKAFIYALVVLAILMKIASPFVINLGGWAHVIMIKLLFVFLSGVCWILLMNVAEGLERASSQFEEYYQRYYESTPIRLLIFKALFLLLPSIIIMVITYYSMSLHWLIRETIYCVQFEFCFVAAVFVTAVVLYIAAVLLNIVH